MELSVMLQFAVVLLGTLDISQVDSLQCYQCINCATVNSQQLKTCNSTTINPPPVPTNVPPNPPTDAPAPTSATDTPAPTSATDAPGPTSATDTPAPTSATDAPGPTSVTDTPAPTSATDAPGPTSATDTPAPTSATDAPGPTSATDTPAPTSATDAPGPTSATDAPGPPEPEGFEVSIVKRSIEFDEDLQEMLLDDDCFCQNGICNCGGRVFFSSFDAKAENLTYVCVTDTISFNGTSVTIRGCAAKANTTQETCVQSLYSQNCTICETDGCNKPNVAASLEISAIILLPVLSAFVKM